MSDQRSHSRSGPASAAGARDGAGGLGHSAAATSEDEALASQAGDVRPMEPGREYVDKTDHDAVVEQLTAERDEMRGDLQRVAADFENYKRRAARERELAASATESKLLGELLSVIDDMERALDHAEQAQAEHPALADGVRMVHSKLDSVVRSHGLERVPTDILFDPNLHEAMMMQPSEDAEDGVILQVLQTGWQLGDRVLRHARVIVAGGA